MHMIVHVNDSSYSYDIYHMPRKENKYRLYHAVEVYTGMYKTAETGLETRARSARVSKVSKVLCIPVYTDTAWYKVFMPCRCTARARTRAMAPAA